MLVLWVGSVNARLRADANFLDQQRTLETPIPDPNTTLPETWSLCPACRYELQGLIASADRVQCPECGRRWSIPQLQNLARGKFHIGRLGWLLLPPPIVIVVVMLILRASVPLWFQRSEEWIVLTTLIATGIWYWSIWTIIFARNAKRRLDEFAYVIGAMLALIPAAVLSWTVVLCGIFTAQTIWLILHL